MAARSHEAFYRSVFFKAVGLQMRGRSKLQEMGCALRVLLVDDDESVLRATTTVLGALGAVVTQARTLAEGQAALSARFDAIICDPTSRR
jgi:PleD family two-component response regulator